MASPLDAVIAPGPLPIRILTHNIRYATRNPFPGEELWTTRRPRLISELRFHTRHAAESLICLQEVLHDQLRDVLDGLNGQKHHHHHNGKSHGLADDDAAAAATAEWAYIGVGRDDGETAGEYAPIVYRAAAWTLLRWEPVWLSPTPARPSRGWDAASIRLVTIGVFRHAATGRALLALNTHLDDQGAEARLQAARLILRKVDEYLHGPDGDAIAGVVLAGDFNSADDEPAYQTLTAPGSPLVDAQTQLPPETRYGNEVTFTGFGQEQDEDEDRPRRIDYVLLGAAHNGSSTWTVKEYAVLANRFDDRVFNSDHRAVVVDALLA
jgi:endonuclease/exonuclease/phosphatase family metal-dependent hydrolase